MWPFSKKVPCFQCDQKVKAKAAILRRGFTLCSPACVTAFLAANTFPRPRGDDAQLREELGHRLVAAIGELARIPGATNPMTGQRTSASGIRFDVHMGGLNAAAGAAIERHANEEAEDAVVQFNAHATAALPYLSALGLQAGFELMDTLDVDALTSAAKRRNVAPIAKLQAELVQILDAL